MFEFCPLQSYMLPCPKDLMCSCYYTCYVKLHNDLTYTTLKISTLVSVHDVMLH